MAEKKKQVTSLGGFSDYTVNNEKGSLSKITLAFTETANTNNPFTGTQLS